MPAIRKRRIYSHEAHHPQENLSDYLRIAYIKTVDATSGSCTIYWLDGGGGRVDVSLSQGAWGEYSIPVPGAIVLVMFDIHDQAKIVRYANLNQFFDQKSVAEGGTNIVQKLQAGDKFWHSSGNAYLYLNSVGRVVLADSEGDTLEIDANANLLKMTAANWKVVSNAGSQYSGDVKRPGVNGPLEPVTDGIPTVLFPSGTPLEEHTIVVNDFNPNNKPVGVTNVKVNLGTYVTDQGLVTDAHGIPTAASSPTALAVRLEVNAPFGTTVVTVDKQGQVQVTSKTIVLNSSDIRLGDELATEQGSLGTSLKRILDSLINLYNTHTHVSGTGIPNVPFIDKDDTDSILSTKVKLR